MNIICVVRITYINAKDAAFFWHAVVPWPRVISRAFDCGASNGPGGTVQRKSGPPPSSAARVLKIQSR